MGILRLQTELLKMNGFSQWCYHSVCASGSPPYAAGSWETTENVTDEATFNRDGMTNTRNSHVWSLDNPHAFTKIHFQSRFSVNIWCRVFGNQDIGPFVLEERLTSERYLRFLEDELPVLLGVPLRIRPQPWLQQDGGSHFCRQATAFLNHRFRIHWTGWQVPVPWPPRSPYLIPLGHYLLVRTES